MPRGKKRDDDDVDDCLIQRILCGLRFRPVAQRPEKKRNRWIMNDTTHVKRLECDLYTAFSWYVLHCPMMSVKQHILRPKNLADWSYSAKAIIPFQLSPTNQPIFHSVCLKKKKSKRKRRSKQKMFSESSIKSIFSVCACVCEAHKCEVLRCNANQVSDYMPSKMTHSELSNDLCFSVTYPFNMSNNRQSPTNLHKSQTHHLHIHIHRR